MRGRPKKPERERRDNVLRVRLTEYERRLLDQVAQENALDTSSWARAALVVLAKKSVVQR